jgi:hypothetical protein
MFELGGLIMIKKLGLLLMVISFLGLLLTGCTYSQYKEKKITEITNVKYNEITKIVFSDGRGGRNKPYTLEDNQKISEFMKLIDNYVIKKEKKHEDFTGWIHRADFYNGDKELMSITFTEPIEIDGKYYDIVKGQLSPEKIDNFIKTAYPSWNIP